MVESDDIFCDCLKSASIGQVVAGPDEIAGHHNKVKWSAEKPNWKSGLDIGRLEYFPHQTFTYVMFSSFLYNKYFHENTAEITDFFIHFPRFVEKLILRRIF